MGRDPNVQSLHQNLPCWLQLGCADLGLGNGTAVFKRSSRRVFWFLFFLKIRFSIFQNCYQINIDYFSTSVFNVIGKHNLMVRDSGSHSTYPNGEAEHHMAQCWDGAGCWRREVGPSSVLGAGGKPLGEAVAASHKTKPARPLRAGLSRLGMCHREGNALAHKLSVHQQVAHGRLHWWQG